MTDTPSFRDIATDAVSEPEKVEVKEEVSTETPEVKQPEKEVQPKEETSEEVEAFADKPELKGKTPEELEEIYNDWQKAYTAKRQKETKELKEYQDKLAKLEKQSPTPKQGEKTIEKLDQYARKQVELGNMSVQEYTEYIQSLMVEQARQIAREEYKVLVAEEREDQLASKALNEFEVADPRLDKHSPNFDESFKNEVQRELAELLDEHLEKTQSYVGFNTKAITKEIVERRDKQLDEIIKKRTMQSTQAAKMREAKSKKSEIRGSSQDGQSLTGDSIRDILSDAMDSAA